MDVKRVAKLARLRIPDEKIAKMEADMEDIVRMV